MSVAFHFQHTLNSLILQVELDKKLATLLAFRSQSLKIHAQHRIAEIEDLKKRQGDDYSLPGHMFAESPGHHTHACINMFIQDHTIVC